jgi:hypothetical protein
MVDERNIGAVMSFGRGSAAWITLPSCKDEQIITVLMLGLMVLVN